jgi:IclR family transcriptional regulator, mhp operon transcriptional activator
MHAKVTPFSDDGKHAATPSAHDPGDQRRDAPRPVRALARGLHVLAELNRLETAPIHALASVVRLPRTTTFRVLETLRLAGYVHRDPHDDCYRPAIMVRALSGGFDDETLLAHIARPHLAAAGAHIAWSLELAAPAGAAMVLREISQSPLAIARRGAGVRIPMLISAAGRAFLAYTEAPQREALLELLARSPLPDDRLARDRPEIERLLHETRTQGFGMSRLARRVSEETSLALPVRARHRVAATLAVRYSAAAVPLRNAIDQLLPKIRDIASKIEREFAQIDDVRGATPAARSAEPTHAG